MNVATTTWPRWLPRVLWVRRVCPACTGTEFHLAEVRRFDGLLALFFLRPVRCKSCWRRYYWISFSPAR